MYDMSLFAQAVDACSVQEPFQQSHTKQADGPLAAGLAASLLPGLVIPGIGAAVGGLRGAEHDRAGAGLLRGGVRGIGTQFGAGLGAALGSIPGLAGLGTTRYDRHPGWVMPALLAGVLGGGLLGGYGGYKLTGKALGPDPWKQDQSADRDKPKRREPSPKKKAASIRLVRLLQAKS